MLASALAAAMLVIKAFPKTPVARWLHLHLVETPLTLAARMTRRHWIFLLVALVLVQGFALVASFDIALVATWDVSLYLDVVASIWLVAAATRVRAGAGLVRHRVTHAIRRVRQLRARRTPRAPRLPRCRVPANDGDSDPAPLMLAA